MADKKKQMDEQNAPAVLVQEDSEETIDLIELLYRLLANWKLIAGSAIAVAIVAALVTLLLIMTPKYEATSTIYVLSRSDSAINMSDLQIGTALTSDYIKVFDMWEVHEGVISNLNLPYNLRGNGGDMPDGDERRGYAHAGYNDNFALRGRGGDDRQRIRGCGEPVYRGNDVDGPAEHHVDGAGASEPGEPQ